MRARRPPPKRPRRAQRRMRSRARNPDLADNARPRAAGPGTRFDRWGRNRGHGAAPRRLHRDTFTMCGLIGIVGRSEVGASLYDALTVLQHRGQDAAGIATEDGKVLHLHKANGLVKDVFQDQHMQLLTGRIGIGHCRYPTAGSEGSAEAQPFYVNSPFGIALAHNGNLVNTEALSREVFEQDRRHINTSSDSEVLLNVFAHELQKQDVMRVAPEHIFRAIAGVHRRCVGGYAVVAMVLGAGVVAFRDPHGIRPLVIGYRDTLQGKEWAV